MGVFNCLERFRLLVRNWIGRWVLNAYACLCHVPEVERVYSLSWWQQLRCRIHLIRTFGGAESSAGIVVDQKMAIKYSLCWESQTELYSTVHKYILMYKNVNVNQRIGIILFLSLLFYGDFLFDFFCYFFSNRIWKFL